MDRLTEILRNESLFKEFLYLCVGLVFISGGNLLFSPVATNFPNYQIFNSVFGFISLIAFAYIVSRISKQIGILIVEILYLPFKIKKTFVSDAKKLFLNFIQYARDSKFTPMPEEIKMNSTGDALDSFKDSRYLKEDYVEVRKDLLIAYCLTGYVTLLSFISIKYESFIPTNYLLIMAFSLAIYSCYKKFQQHLEIRKLIAYYIKKNKSNKVGGPQGSGAPSI